MRPIEKLPPQFRLFEKKGGVLEFAVFEDCDGGDEEIFEGIVSAIPSRYEIESEVLRGQGYRKISERKFFGDWYDFERGDLLKKGHHTTVRGGTMIDPPLRKLDKVRFESGGASLPDIGGSGQFAYAFSHPPYGLSGYPSEIQTVFEQIRDYILPPEEMSIIYDWSNPQLPKVSKFFEAGSEWWGMFLFSIYVPEMRKLTIIAGSTSD